MTVRCESCGQTIRKHWTRDLVTLRIQEWAGVYGEPPSVNDWDPTVASRLGDPERADRFRSAGGHWPSRNAVYRVFGSWNAAVRAAGFEPRAAGGGLGNTRRRRPLDKRPAR